MRRVILPFGSEQGILLLKRETRLGSGRKQLPFSSVVPSANRQALRYCVVTPANTGDIIGSTNTTAHWKLNGWRTLTASYDSC